ncbi:SGM_3592 family protein [Streptomyces sp. KMM 9044]|uniref:SGM_3592 family protein n=1 Tax=Streptomyces sp. KMM 9044 TaxID=2744474 RepID=UPI003FA6D5A1
MSPTWRSGRGHRGRGSDSTTPDDVALDDALIHAAETAEPSARARMLTERWRHEEPEPRPWRSDEPPTGWFFSKARRRGWRHRRG